MKRSTSLIRAPKEQPVEGSGRVTRRRGFPRLRPAGGGPAVALEYREKVRPEMDLSQRPLIGKDIAVWCEANCYERLQVVQMLAMPTPYDYNKITSGQGRLEPIPYDMEMLLRRYMRHQNPPSRRRPTDIFNAVYGEALKEFEGSPSYEPARVMLYSRFGAMLGRTVFSVYRWFKAGTGAGAGVSGTLRRLFEQLPSDPRLMREELEDLARWVFKVRGYDFDALFPMPSTNQPPARRYRRKAAKANANETTNVKEPQKVTRRKAGSDRAVSKETQT